VRKRKGQKNRKRLGDEKKETEKMKLQE